MNGMGDRPARVSRAQRVAHVEHITKEPQRAQEDAEDEDLLAQRRPALDLLHGLEDARVLRVWVERDAQHWRESLQNALAAVAEPSIPVGSAGDLPARMIVDDAGLGYAEGLARLRQIDADVSR